MNQPQDLTRQFNLATSVAILAGITIGSGIFRVPAQVAAATGSPTTMFAVWIAAGLLTLCFALALAELGAMLPKCGGLYCYVREAWGAPAAFVLGWTYLLINPAGWAAIAMVFAEYLGKFVPLDELGRRGVAVGLVLLVTSMNYRSVRLGGAIQNLLSFVKVVALVSLALFIFALGEPADGAPAAAAPSSITLPGFLIGLVAALWAYEGMVTFSSLAGEIKKPGRNIPRALLLGLGAIMLVYLAINAAYLYILPFDVLARSPLVAADAAGRVLGAGGESLIAGLVMVATASAVAAVSLADPRVLFAMGRDGQFFAVTGRIHPRFGTPHVAVVGAGLVACAYLTIRTFEELASTFVLGLMPLYALAVLGVWKLRRDRPDADRPYRAFGYPWVIYLYVATVIAVLINAFVHTPGVALVNLGIALAGIPVYLIWKRFYR